MKNKDQLVEEAEKIRKLGYPEWISVKDRLPEKSISVLTINEDGAIGIAYYHSQNHYNPETGNADLEKFGWEDESCCSLFREIGDDNYSSITHWMPLPEQPV